MRSTVLAIVAGLGLTISMAHAGNYILTIDGKRYEVDIDTPVLVALQDGRKVRAELGKKSIASFKTSAFSFDHPSAVSPSRTDLGDGVHQTMVVTPSGTMVMIQEYLGMNPSALVDFMLSELMKEEVQYGYKVTKSPATKKLADGRRVSGKRAISKYRADEYERYVLCYGMRDAGIMIVTQVERAAPREDKAMLDQFWKTMRMSLR